MLTEKKNIEKYIPQRAPFIMVDALVEIDDSGFRTRYTITSDNLLLYGNFLSESGLIECVAQSCALGFGYDFISKGYIEIPLGFIGSVSKLEIFDFAKLDDILDIKIKLIGSFNKIQLVEGVIFINSKQILKCQMKIVNP